MTEKEKPIGRKLRPHPSHLFVGGFFVQNFIVIMNIGGYNSVVSHNIKYMKNINKILVIAGVAILVLGSFAFGLSKASAEDRNNSDSENRDQKIAEVQKKAEENASEALKKNIELQREVSDKLKIEDNGTSSDENENDNSTSTNEKEDNGDLHRSTVAQFVQKLHEIASSTSRGIGEQVREVAREEDESKDKTAENIKALDSQSAFMKFLVGVSDNNVKELQNSVATIQNHIEKLNQIKASSTPEVQKSLTTEAETLAAEQARVQSVIDANKNRISLFGWFFNLFR